MQKTFGTRHWIFCNLVAKMGWFEEQTNHIREGSCYAE
jgi:hypothetical protein